MKRTIIAAAACGAVMATAACAPPTAPGPTSSTQPDADRATSPASDASAPSRESASADTGRTTSQSPTESRDDDPAASADNPTVDHGVSDDTVAPEGTRASASTTATRRGDGRARIGDPCPGLDGALRPAVNGEDLVCAGGPVPRWTVILDEPTPGETTDQPTDTTDEPTVTADDATGGDGPSGAPQSTTDSMEPTQ